jgi:hypothetical protein
VTLPQQLKKRGACLYAATFDNYVQAFNHMTLYYQFKKHCHFEEGPTNLKVNLFCIEHAKLVI